MTLPEGLPAWDVRDMSPGRTPTGKELGVWVHIDFSSLPCDGVGTSVLTVRPVLGEGSSSWSRVKRVGPWGWTTQVEDPGGTGGAPGLAGDPRSVVGSVSSGDKATTSVGWSPPCPPSWTTTQSSGRPDGWRDPQPPPYPYAWHPDVGLEGEEGPETRGVSWP